MEGYSGTPLPRKLGVKPGHRVLVLRAPEAFVEHALAGCRKALRCAGARVAAPT